MKKILALGVLTLSLNVLAADMDTYCLPFLNGELKDQGEKPALLEGFVASKAKMEVAGSMVETIDIALTDVELQGEVKSKTYPWGEESEMTVMKFKKNGKQVKDYKMIVSRDKEGNLISIAKKPILLQDFRFKADTLYFKPQGGKCIPQKYIAKNKLEFSVDLCREIDRFFVENPSAKECLAARHDQKLASLVKEHAKALGEKIILYSEKVDEDMGSLYSAAHRLDCALNGLNGLLDDKSIWESYIGKRGEEKVKNPETKEE